MAAIPVVKKAWPGNAEGLRQLTVPTMCKFIRDEGDDPEMKSLTGNVLKKAGFPESIVGKATAIRAYLKTAAGYAPDQPMREWVQSPKITLCCEGASVCIPIEDCDGLQTALGAMLRNAGIEVMVQGIHYGEGIQDHVNLVLRDDAGNWVEIDATTDMPIGYVTKAKKKWLLDPMNPDVVPSDTPEGAFIGVGRAHLPPSGASMLEESGMAMLQSQGRPARPGAGRPVVGYPAVDPAMRLIVGSGAPSPGDVLAYRALWDDYVLQTVCAYSALAWALGFLIQGQSPPSTIDVTAPSIAGIPYCVRTIPTWNYALPLVDTSQFGDNPPTVAELTSVQAAATTSAASLLGRWNVWSGLSDYEIVQDAAQILTSMQGVVSDTGTTERPFLSRYSPSLGAAIAQGPSQSKQAQIIARLEGAKIVAGGILTVFGFGVQGAIESTETLGQWTAQHAKELGEGATGLAAFLLSPWTLSIAALLILGSAALAVHNADKVSKLAASIR